MNAKNIRKAIGGFLIALGILFLTPPIIPVPDDFLNFGAAFYISSTGMLNSLNALIFTYTLLPLSLLLAGIIVYPRKNGVVAQMVVNKLRRLFGGWLKWMKKSLLNMAISAAFFVILYFLYSQMLNSFI